MTEKGVPFFCITPQSVENNKEFSQKLRLKFEILHDHENAYAAKLDLAHGFPDDLKEVYTQFGIDVAATNGEPSWTLPIPTQIVVETDHTIKSIQYDADYKKRPEPEELLAMF